MTDDFYKSDFIVIQFGKNKVSHLFKLVSKIYLLQVFNGGTLKIVTL